MRFIFLPLLSLCVLTAVAQPKAAIESVEIFDKSNHLVLPAVIAKVDKQTTYASRYLYGDAILTSEIYVKVIRPQANAEKANYLLEATTIFPETGRFQIEKKGLMLPNTKRHYFFAVFGVWSTSEFCVKDAAGNLNKRFILNDNELTKCYYCRVGEEFKMVPETEFQAMLSSPDTYKLSGHTSLQALDIDLVSVVAGSGDKRDTKEKNLDYVRAHIKNNVKSTASAIADLLFGETHLNGFLKSGFKMHVLKKSSAKHYAQIEDKTDAFKSLAAGWSQDIDNEYLQGQLMAAAIEFEKLDDEATDENIRILCYSA